MPLNYKPHRRRDLGSNIEMEKLTPEKAEEPTPCMEEEGKVILQIRCRYKNRTGQYLYVHKCNSENCWMEV